MLAGIVARLAYYHVICSPDPYLDVILFLLSKDCWEYVLCTGQKDSQNSWKQGQDTNADNF